MALKEDLDRMIRVGDVCKLINELLKARKGEKGKSVDGYNYGLEVLKVNLIHRNVGGKK